MKKLVSLFLLAAMLFSVLTLNGCGKASLSPEDVQAALADCDGELNMELSGCNVTAFTYTVAQVNAEDLTDRSYTEEAMLMLSTGQSMDMTWGQIQTCQALLPVMAIINLLQGEDSSEADLTEFLDDVLDIACTGKAMEFGGWAVSASIDIAADSITISVNPA